MTPRPSPVRSRRRVAALVAPVLFALLALSSSLFVAAEPAGASPARINGTGSSYVALAMQQWVADAQTNGLQVNYLPTNSPTGLNQYSGSVVDFAGTEAEFASLGVNTNVARGFQYVPDVAGAVAIMYNVDDPSGRKVTTLHLSRMTIAKIFMGVITSWDDPAITADNKGYPLPAQPITVVYRSGLSGTTALFYDFVANIDQGDFGPWAAKNQFPTDRRIIQLGDGIAPKTVALGGSDQIAQYVGSAGGKWSIAYDEFGYATTYKVPAAWVQNQSGNYVLPYAQNIASALKSAQLHDDLSQDLTRVYVSPDADAYPISAYSYVVTQCAPDAARATCKGPYATTGITETLEQWLRYIACEGQVNMAKIGYSPLPANLSNEIAKSIGRMKGAPAEVLNQGNCANPTFAGSLGGPPPPADPLQNTPARAGGGPAAAGGNRASAGDTKTTGPKAAGSNGAADAGTTGDTTVASAADASSTDSNSGELAAVQAEDASAGGGGAGPRRAISPVAYQRADELAGGFPLPLLLLLALVLIPPLVSSIRRRRL